MTGKDRPGWGSDRPPVVATGSLGGPQGEPSPHPSPPNPHPPLVIGVGNRLRGDDAAGLLVADLLQGRLGRETVVVSDGDAADLVMCWEEVDSVIVVDAMVSGRPPGTIARHEVTAEPLPVDAFAGSSHRFGLAEAIEISRALDTLPPRFVVYGIEVQATALGTPLSPQVVAAVRRVVDAVAAEVAEIAAATRPAP